ncbi:uncharacterized protein VTP21DRAFT_4633 [Calcarisporiella thermophila]|uniref:uncharacterized protein n=1 Tax=Calcarisporiella thermophila TaxID=911321 RepID=UPI003742A73E
MHSSIFLPCSFLSLFIFLGVVKVVSSNDIAVHARSSEQCVLQMKACDLICQDYNMFASVNDCDETTLSYCCICNNGVAPGISELSQCSEGMQRCIPNLKIRNANCTNICNDAKCSSISKSDDGSDTRTVEAAEITERDFERVDNKLVGIALNSPSSFFTQNEAPSSAINLGFVVFLSAAVFFNFS